jgi:ATP-dependent exoDNAse (exonuclease V) alpha subunit
MTELESRSQGPNYHLLAGAITIHKSQGIALEKVTIDIGNKDFSSSLSFVALVS